MKKDSIGVFDSGLGGLTAVKELLSILPNENIVYFGDTGRVPYGTRSFETIQKYAFQDVHFLMDMNVKLIIVACGTVSSVANQISKKIPIPFIGVVKPTSMAAVRATKNNKIGIIGTTATIKSKSYKKEITAINNNIKIYEKDCPLFVPLVESGFVDENDAIVKLIVKRYLKSFIEYDIDTLILGCTHYPIISKAISNFMGSKVKIIDSGKETALYAKKFLQSQNLLNNSNHKGKYSFYVSDSTEGFSKNAEIFLQNDIKHNVSFVDIEKY